MNLKDFLRPRCYLCGKSYVGPLCSECKTYLPKAESFCSSCGIYVEVNRLSAESTLCGKCLTAPLPYQHTVPAFWYEEPIQTLIQDYKFHQKLFLTSVLGNEMAETIQNHYHKKHAHFPAVIIPVPLHAKRLRERGYYPVGELAKILSKRLSIPIDFRSCQKNRHTLSQSQIPFSERKENVKNAFSAKHIPYHHIALVDDVVTTGETLLALSKAILKSNPSLQITIWCLARTNII